MKAAVYQQRPGDLFSIAGFAADGVVDGKDILRAIVTTWFIGTPFGAETALCLREHARQ
jgi:hypothetical protein